MVNQAQKVLINFTIVFCKSKQENRIAVFYFYIFSGISIDNILNVSFNTKEKI